MSKHPDRDFPISVTGRHGSLSQRMQDYATAKAEKLGRFHPHISRIEVVVDGPHEAPEVELVVHLDRAANLVTKESASHFNEAVDHAADKMERRLVKANEKRQHHPGEPRITDLPPEPGPGGGRNDR